MRRAFAGSALVVMLVLALMGCGGAGEDAGSESPAATTSAESPASGWSTVVTLSSSDPTNEMDLHVSDEFTVAGDAQVVLDMPDGEDMDGVVAAFLPAGQPITAEAGMEAQSIALAKALPTQVVSGLDGDYVLLVTPSTATAWTVEVRTQE